MDIDLLDMSKYSKENAGIKYILTAIEIFSRYGYAYPLKIKSQDEVLSAIKYILQKEKVNSIRSNKGGEFNSQKISKFFKKNNIKHFVSQNEEIKSNYVERFNKTIKRKQNQTYT